MEQTIFTPKNGIFALIAVLVLIGGGYYAYTVFSQAPVENATELDISSFDPNLIAFINVKSKINLKHKDISFLNPGPAAEIYKLLIDNTETIPMTDSRGRPDPFTPYATTGPIR